MNTRLLAMIVSTLSLSALAACNKAEAPADTASDVAEARQRAYAGVAELSWPGMTVRTDIAAAVAS